jgi:SAM-dependent methyltransferase
MDVVKTKILSAYEQMAEQYNALIDHKPHNAYYDRPNTLALLGEVAGLDVLDAACGPGKYAEILLDQGARVTGFDLSPEMVRHAQARNPGRGHFFVQDLAAPFNTLPDAAFEVVLCALALHYIPDWTLTLREFHRVLRPGGRVVVSMEHPFFDYQYYRSEKYFEVEHVHGVWRGFGRPVEVHAYRRPLGACLAPFCDNGFYIDQVLEPRPVPEFAQHDLRHFKELNQFPGFLHLSAVKKTS